MGNEETRSLTTMSVLVPKMVGVCTVTLEQPLCLCTRRRFAVICASGFGLVFFSSERVAVACLLPVGSRSGGKKIFLFLCFLCPSFDSLLSPQASLHSSRLDYGKSKPRTFS